MKYATIPLAFVLAIVWGVRVAAQAAAPARGPEDAVVRIEAFLDFDSEPSARLSVVLERLVYDEPQRVRVIFRHLPRSKADQPVAPAHLAAVAAGAQNQFWEMESLLFANQDRHSPADLSRMATQLGLDERRFEADMNMPSTLAVVTADAALAKERGVTSAPSIVANGHVLTGARTLDELRALIPR